MTIGKVTPNREAATELTVTGLDGSIDITAVIDTGFTGYLTLPSDVIEELGLEWAGSEVGALADGQVVELNAYIAHVTWQELHREVIVLEAAGGPLLGMSLLYGYRLTLDVVEGGDVALERLGDS